MFNEKVKAKRINISGLLGQVTIKTHDSNKVKIETTEEDKVEIKHSIATLHIGSKDDGSSVVTSNRKGSFIQNIFSGSKSTIITGNNSSSIVIGSGNISGQNITIQNGNVIVDGKAVNGTSINTMAFVDMTIYVPKDMVESIDISGQIKVSVEGISNKIEIDSSGQTQIKVEDIKRISLDVSNQSKAYINGVEILKADLSGQSDVDITGTDIKEINIDGSGQSNIYIDSVSIDNLDIDISGMSNVRVKGKIVNKSISKSGMSNVTFK